MENIFKVDTKHTAGNLKEFILFIYRTQYPRVSRNFIFVGVVLLMASMVKKFNFSGSTKAVFWIFGISCLLMGFFRHYIALVRTMNDDPAYRGGWKYSFQFTQKGIRVYTNGELEQAVGGYNHISALYEDEKNFYVKMDDNQVHLLPKKDFTEGSPDEFAAYIEERSRVERAWSPAQVKNRFKKMMEKQKAFTKQREEQMEQARKERAKRKRSGKQK